MKNKTNRQKIIDELVNISLAGKCAFCNHRGDDSICPNLVQYPTGAGEDVDVCRDGINKFWGENLNRDIQ